MEDSENEERQFSETDSDGQLSLNTELFNTIYKRYIGEANKVEIERMEQLERCLSEGADINAVDKNNHSNTVLHVAIKKNCSKIIEYLLTSGARTDIENSKGKNALALAQSRKCNQEILDLLKKHLTTSNIGDFGGNEQSSHTVKIDYLPQKLDMWNNLKTNSEVMILEVNSGELSPDFLHQGEFYDAINTAGNLFFVDVVVSEWIQIDEDAIVNRLQNIDPHLIIQYGSVSKTKVYYKDKNGDVIIIDLNSSIECNDKEILRDKLISEDGFGLDLIVEALKLELVGTFETERRSLLRVSFHLEEPFDSLRLIECAIKFGDLMTVRLLSLSDWKLTKRNGMGSTTLSVAAEYGSMEKFAAVLRIKFPIPLHSIEFPSKYYGQMDKLLNSALKKNNCDVIRFLKRCGAKVENVIDSKWDDKRYDVVLSLLKEDCVFPLGFDLDWTNSSDVSGDNSVSCPENDVNLNRLRAFVAERQHLHDLIEEGNLKYVQEFVGSVATSKLYLNVKNQSALYKALECYKIDIYWWFKIECKAEFRNNDERDSLGVGVLNWATGDLFPRFHCIVDAHIHNLLSNSRCCQHKASFKKEITAIYKDLDSIPLISTVFKVIHSCDQVDIIFDFDKGSVEEVDLTSSNTTTGSCKFKLGRIYIGAKVKDKRELLGTIAHEFTHQAIETVFKNNCDPYKDDDSLKVDFDKIVAEMSGKSKSVDDIISRVFDVYKEPSWPSELIVRVNQMLAKYGLEEGLTKLEEQAKALLEFYTKHVEPRLQSFVAESHLIRDRQRIKCLNEMSGVISSLKEVNVKSNDTKVVHDFLSNKAKHVLVLSSTSTWLSLINVLQNLENLSEDDKFENLSEDSFLVFQFDKYLSRKDEINQAVFTKAGKLLVLQCPTELQEQQFKDALSDLSQLQWKTLNKKIILIVESYHLVVLQEHLQSKSPNLVVEIVFDDKFTSNNLTSGSIQALLMKQVSWQNRPVPLVDLVDAYLYSCVETKFERSLLVHFLQHSEGRVVIIDEIKETHRSVIKDLLVALKSSILKQLWVITVPHTRHTLENTLHPLLYTLFRC